VARRLLGHFALTGREQHDELLQRAREYPLLEPSCAASCTTGGAGVRHHVTGRSGERRQPTMSAGDDHQGTDLPIERQRIFFRP